MTKYLIYAVLGLGLVAAVTQWVKAREEAAAHRALAEARADSLDAERSRIVSLMQARDSAEQDFLERLDSLNVAIERARATAAIHQQALNAAETELTQHLEGDTVGERILTQLSRGCRESIEVLEFQVTSCQAKDSINQMRIAARDSSISELDNLVSELNGELRLALERSSPGFLARVWKDLPWYGVAFVSGIVVWEAAR